ncbi:unnamed protein product, partial [Ophioblennius macclurei]
MVVVFSL